MSVMSTSEFCGKLREVGVALVSGSSEEVVMPLNYIYGSLSAEDAAKISSSYIRTVINRTPGLKEIGAISVKKRTSDDGIDKYHMTLNRNPNRKVITDKDVPGVKQKAREKLAAELLEVMPNVTDLDGDELAGAVKAIGRYQDLIKSKVVSND